MTCPIPSALSCKSKLAKLMSNALLCTRAVYIIMVCKNSLAVWCVRVFVRYIKAHNFHMRSTWKVAGGALIYAQIIGGALIKHDTSQVSAQCGRQSIKVAQFITLRAKVFPIELEGSLSSNKGKHLILSLEPVVRIASDCVKNL